MNKVISYYQKTNLVSKILYIGAISVWFFGLIVFLIQIFNDISLSISIKDLINNFVNGSRLIVFGLLIEYLISKNVLKANKEEKDSNSNF